MQELVPAREIFLRTDGKVRFLRVSSRAQWVVLGMIGSALAGWAGFTGVMLWSQAGVAIERSVLDQDRTKVQRQQAQVNAYRKSVSDVAQEIEARQDALDHIVRTHLGGDGKAVRGLVGEKAAPSSGTAAPGTISAATPGTAPLEKMRARQDAFESRLLAAAERRIVRLEGAIRRFGVNPAQIAAQGAMGGPFIPAMAGDAQDIADLRDLAATLARMRALETGLASMPSGRPTQAPMETSSYGYRRDPFNGLAAFHAGIDFRGTYGQPILSAADGRVSYVGVRNGYGNVVEIEHGRGFMTRYAHLSGFRTRVGESVARGQEVGRMGSTGRSTGTHLHFEVRVNGAAVDPRPFLEARQDVLEIQQLARQKRAIGGNGR